MYHQKIFIRNENSKVSLYQMLKSETRQFCSNTALHGYKYIADTDNSVCTRITWTFLTSAAFLLGFILVFLSWQYNINHKFVTIADSVHNPIWNYRFPTVTICNLNKVSLRKAKVFAEEIKKPEGFNIDYILMLFSYLVKLLYLHYDCTNSKYYNELRTLLDMNNLTAQEVMIRIRPECKELLHSCSLKGHIWRCDSIFEEMTTVEGLCCATNYYALKNREFSGYLPERYKKKPRRMSACGYKTGYRILLNNMPEDYLLSEISGYGTKVLIHDAFNYADWSASNELVPMQSQNFISVAPTILYATEAIKNMKISDRKCVFIWERSLKYFANYSYDNCVNECRLNIIKKKCGCVPLFYWSIKGYDKIPPCDIKHAACVAIYYDLIVSNIPGLEYEKTEDSDYELAKEQGLCKCMPDCETFEYATDTARSKFSRKHSLNEMRFYDNVQSDNHSVINVYYKDLIAMRNIRDVNLSWYAELSWFGGLVGLCVGFSLTSGFEILYYLTIRLVIGYFYKQNQSKKTNVVKPFKDQQLNGRNLDDIFIVRNNYHFVTHQTVPAMQDLYNLRRTKNEWFYD